MVTVLVVKTGLCVASGMAATSDSSRRARWCLPQEHWFWTHLRLGNWRRARRAKARVLFSFQCFDFGPGKCAFDPSKRKPRVASGAVGKGQDLVNNFLKKFLPSSTIRATKQPKHYSNFHVVARIRKIGRSVHGMPRSAAMSLMEAAGEFRFIRGLLHGFHASDQIISKPRNKS